MSLRDIEFLSIWEVAHRWEGVDSDEESPDGPPAKVRARLRNLIQAVTVRLGLFCFDVHGERLEKEARSLGVLRRTKWGRQLDNAVLDPVGQKEFLKTVFLRKYWVDGWYLGREVLPEYWFGPGIVEISRKCLGAGSASSAEPARLRSDEQEGATGQTIEKNTGTLAARKAVRRRFEPLNRLNIISDL